MKYSNKYFPTIILLYVKFDVAAREGYMFSKW